MGSLSNLYISQSYQGLIHLATNTSASANLIQLQDGLGNNLGVSLNTQGDISASGDLTANTLRIELDTEITGGVDINTFFTASTPGYTNSTNPYFTDVVRVIGSYGGGGIPPTINDVKVGWICNGINVTNGIVTAVSGSGTGDVYVTIAGSLPQISQPYTFTGMVTIPTRITGSLQVSNDITASSMQLRGDLFVSGTIHAYEVITTVESASVIFSSGSNVIGDSTSDTQTIVGQTTISGSLTLTGVQRNTGSLFVSNEISSSTINGIGNVTTYSASVDSRLDYLEGPFSTSVDQRLDSLEFFSSSQEAKDLTLASYTGSNDTKWNTLTNVTASLLLFSSSQEAKDLTLASYTGSNDTKWSTLTNVTASLFAFTSSQETKDITLGAYTASLITAFTASGANVAFNGNITVSGSISAYQLNVLVESSSVIYSSGSNVLGDASSDTQTLNGTVNVVNTLFVSGTEFTPFSASVDLRLDTLEAFSSSLIATFATDADLAITASVLQGNINQKLFTSSFQTYTSSQDTKNSTLATYTGSIDTKWSTIGNLTGSYITSGSNSFNGNQIITGSLILSSSATTELTVIGNSTFSGSVNGRVIPLTITSNTASMDCSSGNFFTLALVSGSTTRLENSNILAGETLTIQLTQPSVSFGNLVFGNGFKFPSTSPYVITTTANAIDILTFVTFGTSSLMGVSVNNLV